MMGLLIIYGTLRSLSSMPAPDPVNFLGTLALLALFSTVFTLVESYLIRKGKRL